MPMLTVSASLNELKQASGSALFNVILSIFRCKAQAETLVRQFSKNQRCGWIPNFLFFNPCFLQKSSYAAVVNVEHHLFSVTSFKRHLSAGNSRLCRGPSDLAVVFCSLHFQNVRNYTVNRNIPNEASKEQLFCYTGTHQSKCWEAHQNTG